MFGQMAKWVAQIDRAERVPEMVATRSPRGLAAVPGRWCWRCRRTCSRRRRLCQTTAHYQRVAAPSRQGRHEPAARHACAGAERPFVIDRRRRMERPGLRGLRGASRRRTRCRSAPPTAVRTSRQPRIPITSATSRIGLNPALAQPYPRLPTCCSRSARASVRWTTHIHFAGHTAAKQKFVHVHAGAGELGRVYQAVCWSIPACRSSPPRRAPSLHSSAVGRGDRERRARNTRHGSSTLRRRARSTWAK